ncbi:MAG: LLM class flavin-dependent oxidoreductase [Candidatus Dormibacteraeota bacterium]|nr:LLM class flavin-dependent oxidoreductase [Candidatus Dormibacteraeota bacterium]MBO0761117.1 LLM class flavin-dependent oxidoreductase [Candidatus Dormibacteraeota bacterium]
MSIHLHWFLPTSGDGREVASQGVGAPDDPHTRPRAATLAYLSQIARAAEQLGFEAALTPTGLHCEDAWLITAALSRETERLKFLVAFRPGFVSPTLAGHQAATYQRVTGGRLLLNVVTGGDAAEQRRYGDWLEHDARYERTAEFLTVLQGAWSGDPFDFDGEHYRVEGARVSPPPEPRPAVYFGGASPAAQRVAARHADVYLLWAETPEMVEERLHTMRELAAGQGRTLRFGIRLHVIPRDTEEEAWAHARWLLDHMEPEAISQAQAKFAATESVGQQRMVSLHGGRSAGGRGESPHGAGGRSDGLEVAPNLWAGFGLVRGGAGTGLVGGHEQVADRIQEYHHLGVDEFILSGYPHLEEAYAFGEGVTPILRGRGLLDSTPQAPASAPAAAPVLG